MDPTPDSFHTLQQALVALLEQGEDLLEALTDGQYIETHAEAHASPVGSHYRHTLEHVTPLLDPLQDGLLDYDERDRDPQLETDRQVALATTRELLARSRDLDPGTLAQPVQVRCSVSACPTSPVVASSLAREVMFAELHAIHHYAIIKILCTLMEVALPETFGIAPSTLNYQLSNAG